MGWEGCLRVAESDHEIARTVLSIGLNANTKVLCRTSVLARGGAERKIRKYLVDNNYVDAVIQLPPDLFFWYHDWYVHHCAEEVQGEQ